MGLGGSLNRKNRFRSPKEEMTPGELLAGGGGGGEERRMIRGRSSWRCTAGWATRWRRWPSRCWARRWRSGGRQSGRAWGYLLTLGGYVPLLSASRGFENLGNQGKLPVLLAGQLANVIFIALGVLAMWRVSRSGTVR